LLAHGLWFSLGTPTSSTTKTGRHDIAEILLRVFRLLTDFVCLYNYEFGLSLCKIVRSSVILLLPLFISVALTTKNQIKSNHITINIHYSIIYSKKCYRNLSFLPTISTCWLHQQNSYQSSGELSRILTVSRSYVMASKFWFLRRSALY
jgi:hypothetical protein